MDIDTTTTTTPREERGIRSEQGQALVEYALILGFVSLTAVALTPIGQWVALSLSDVANAL